MPLLETARKGAQILGRGVSHHVFTEDFLARPIGKRLYLLLYRSFKYVFEHRQLRALDVYLSPGSAVLDIGANVGITSAYFADRVGETGCVIAIEPDPVMADLFRFHMEQTHRKNIRLMPIALGAEDGIARLFRNLSNRADNRLVADQEGMGDTKELPIPVRTLSSLAKEDPEVFARIRFIKMDVQGYEYQVLLGMVDWLKGLRQKPIIYLEFWPYGLAQAGSSPQALLDLVGSLGYSYTSVPSDIEMMKKTHAYTDLTLIPRP